MDNTIITGISSSRFLTFNIEYETYAGDIDFSYSTFTSVKNIKIRHPLIGYKIGYLYKDECQIMTLITLKIPLTARIAVPFGEYNTKLRCSRAKVLDINPIFIEDGIPHVAEDEHIPFCSSLYGVMLFSATDDDAKKNNMPIGYVIGKTVRPDKFNPDRKFTCAQGIHFFLTKYNALAFLLNSTLVSCSIYTDTDTVMKYNQYFDANEDIQFYNQKDWR